MNKNAQILPTIAEIGQTNLHDFQHFLNKFNIPFSGPYKKISENGRFKLQYFVSGTRPYDCVFNSNYPLYGIYEFRLNSLSYNPDDSKSRSYISELTEMPFWLLHIPPLFNQSLAHIRENA